MARTKQEVRDFLNGLVNQSVNAKTGKYKGQCVSLIKALFEFLGVNDPYKARGDAKYAGDTYLREGIASNGQGWLMVAVNRDMGVIGGVSYGHIWIDLQGEANFEQNGAKALHVTKNTRPIQRAQQLINLDKYIKADPAPTPAPNFAMPPIGSNIQLVGPVERSTFRAGTTDVAGKLNVGRGDNRYVYQVRGYDAKYPGRIIINSASAGGNGVALALFYTNGARIEGWRVL